ncbi:MAG: ribosome small subunit-dependent GTPase A [Saprospiraceae bacterium]|nr:ribosome small subunit-dependent GTPase A [Saprospiraceae bacterium]
MRGLVFKSTGLWYEVFVKEEEKVYHSRLAGRLKLYKSELTNPVAVGDYVSLEKENETQAIIVEIEKRKNYIVRQSPKNKHQLHLLAANIDLAVLITTLREPMFKQGFIDRFLMTTEPQDIPVLIIFNKSDLYNEQDLKEYDLLSKIYKSIGYKVRLVSCESEDGIQELELDLQNKVSLISGQSGVGKSSLINLLIPEAMKKTNEISDFSGKGTHTTTFAEMLELNSNSYIIDSPGIKTLSFNNLEIMDVAHNFREFFTLSEACKFGRNCTHRDEPECRIKQGLDDGSVYFFRYQNYLNILEEIESQNYWERKKEY